MEIVRLEQILNCAVGAGSIVIKDITESGTYVGCPVRKL